MLLTKLFGKAKNYTSDILDSKSKQQRLNTCESCSKYRKDFTFLLIFKKKNIPQCGKMRPDSISLDYLFQMFKDNIDPKFDGKCGKCKKRVIGYWSQRLKSWEMY